MTNEQARDGLSNNGISGTSSGNCIQELDCVNAKYRTIDGSCNNLGKPLWGKSNTAFVRIVPPAYADGLSDPRISHSGGQLPSARVISVGAATDQNIEDKKLTLFVMQWGQVCHSLIEHSI